MGHHGGCRGTLWEPSAAHDRKAGTLLSQHWAAPRKGHSRNGNKTRPSECQVTTKPVCLVRVCALDLLLWELPFQPSAWRERVTDQPENSLRAPGRLANTCPKGQERGKWWQRREQDLSPLSSAPPLHFSLSTNSKPPAGPPTPAGEGVAPRMSLTEETAGDRYFREPAAGRLSWLLSLRCGQPQAHSASRHSLAPAWPLQVRTRGGASRVTQALFEVEHSLLSLRKKQRGRHSMQLRLHIQSPLSLVLSEHPTPSLGL